MSRLIIRWDAESQTWSVFRRMGRMTRYVTSFPTLLEAEQYVVGLGKKADPA